jgi:hypothetical protein
VVWSSTVVCRGEAADGSLIEELKRREAAARAEADRLRARDQELAGALARAEEQASRLAIAWEEVTRVLEEPAAEVRAGQADGSSGEPRPASGDFSPASEFKSRFREISPVQVPSDTVVRL